jgi:hypothetical protein
MFLDSLPAFGRRVDRRGPTKPSAMEIMEYGPTRSRTLKNADDQNAIALLVPKSHINSYRVLSIAEHHHASTSATRDRCTLFRSAFVGRAKRN